TARVADSGWARPSDAVPSVVAVSVAEAWRVPGATASRAAVPPVVTVRVADRSTVPVRAADPPVVAVSVAAAGWVRSRSAVPPVVTVSVAEAVGATGAVVVSQSTAWARRALPSAL